MAGGAVFVGDIANGEEYLNPSLDIMSGHGGQQAMLMYDQSAQKGANTGKSWARLGGVVQPGICADMESHRGAPKIDLPEKKGRQLQPVAQW
jgi:hypothetical protein